MVIILFVYYFVMWDILKQNLLNNLTSCFIRLVSLLQGFRFRNCLKEDNLWLMISLNKLICGKIPCSKEPISVDFSWSCWSLITFFASSFHITSYEQLSTMVRMQSTRNTLQSEIRLQNQISSRSLWDDWECVLINNWLLVKVLSACSYVYCIFVISWYLLHLSE